MLEIDFLVGETVVEVRKDYRIVFDAGPDPAPRLYADVNNARLCLDSDQQPLSLTCLVGRTVASASTAGGVLSLAFTDGATVRCDPLEEFEAWQVVSTQPEVLVICLPGGELTGIDDRPPSASGDDRA